MDSKVGWRWAFLGLAAVFVLTLGWCVPNDTPDWQPQVQTYRRPLYPEGSGALNPPTPSVTLAANGSTTVRFLLPAGTVAVRFLATAGGLKFAWSLNVTGHQTVEQYFGDPNAPGGPIAVATPTAPVTIPVENDWDSEVDVSIVGDPAHATNYFVSAMFVAESPGQSGSAQSVVEPTPQSWQSPASTWMVASGGLVGGATGVLVAAVAGQTVSLHAHEMHLTAGAAGSFGALQDSGGTGLTGINFAVADVYGRDMKGRALVTGLGLQIKNTSGANSGSINGGGEYTQR